MEAKELRYGNKLLFMGEVVTSTPTETIEQICMVCSKKFIDTPPEFCCSGKDCGCMGMPIDPVVCSHECYNNLPINKKQCEKKCGDNHCDNNGCVNRKRISTNLQPLESVSIEDNLKIQFEEYLLNADSETRRMYGHHLRSFTAGWNRHEKFIESQPNETSKLLSEAIEKLKEIEGQAFYLYDEDKEIITEILKKYESLNLK